MRWLGKIVRIDETTTHKWLLYAQSWRHTLTVGYQNYEGWIWWQTNWQMLVLITGKGKTPRNREIWRKNIEEAKAHPTLLKYSWWWYVCIYVSEILNKFLSTAFSLVHFNKWDACVLAVFVLQTVRSALCGKCTVKKKSNFTRVQAAHTPHTF